MASMTTVVLNQAPKTKSDGAQEQKGRDVGKSDVVAGVMVGSPCRLLLFSLILDLVSFFLSLVWKTQANHWTKQMVNT